MIEEMNKYILTAQLGIQSTSCWLQLMLLDLTFSPLLLAELQTLPSFSHLLEAFFSGALSSEIYIIH